MIKIIKPGNTKITIRTFLCNKCNCKFKATEEHWKDISQHGPIMYGVDCPTCRHIAKEIWEHADNLPIDINKTISPNNLREIAECERIK